MCYYRCCVGTVESISWLGKGVVIMARKPKAVIYLSFEGGIVRDTIWNTSYTDGAPIVAAPSSCSLTEHNRWINGVRAAYSEFPIDVRTDIYDDPEPDWSKQNATRIIITDSDSDWTDRYVAGIARVGSVNWSADVPCFTFRMGQICWANMVPTINIVHELGHTFGLTHSSDPDSWMHPTHGDQDTNLRFADYEKEIIWQALRFNPKKGKFRTK